MLTFETGAWRTMADLSEDGLNITYRDARISCIVDSRRSGGANLKICLYIYVYMTVQVSEQADHPARSTSHRFFSLAVVLLVLKRDESAL